MGTAALILPYSPIHKYSPLLLAFPYFASLHLFPSFLPPLLTLMYLLHFSPPLPSIVLPYSYLLIPLLSIPSFLPLIIFPLINILTLPPLFRSIKSASVSPFHFLPDFLLFVSFFNHSTAIFFLQYSCVFIFPPLTYFIVLHLIRKVFPAVLPRLSSHLEWAPSLPPSRPSFLPWPFFITTSSSVLFPPSPSISQAMNTSLSSPASKSPSPAPSSRLIFPCRAPHRLPPSFQSASLASFPFLSLSLHSLPSQTV